MFEDTAGRALDEYMSLFRDEPVIFLGSATCGRSAGAHEIERVLLERASELSVECSIVHTGCMGLCYAEPMVTVFNGDTRGAIYGPVNRRLAKRIIQELADGEEFSAIGSLNVAFNGDSFEPSYSIDFMEKQSRRILRRCGLIDPENINHYLATGGYRGLLRALEMKPEDIIEEVKDSGLRGRGGAGFPTWLKWSLCRQEESDVKYLVCNADEGDPGAFMNRSLIEGDPHSLLEGILIASYAVGAEEAYIYCRAEYPLALERLRTAISDLRDLGLLGEDILDSGFSLDIRIKEGAGAFVCGEETALIASIEGKRGMPRTRPPFPTTSGLWGRPTVINNVETLAAVSMIMQHGPEYFNTLGTEGSPGTKTFSLVGDVRRTGLIEVPLGTSLREVIHDIGGGVRDGELKAVQIGGPSGGCLPAELVDTGIDYDSLTSAGAIMGSGGLVVLSDHTCMVELARYFLEFTQRESCGKCVPCRVGTRQMLMILNDIVEGSGREEDPEILRDIAETVRAASLCGLGQTSPNPVLTTLRYFENEYHDHINGKCTAASCSQLMHYLIEAEKCDGCMACLKTCPADAIEGSKDEVHVIDQESCLNCGSCLDTCKRDAVLRVPGPYSPANQD
ncbi:NADH-quinone oxidoreductase subunit NuoF [Methanothermobacter sp. THM-2]|uniref:NADH-quinone oxidoreductase subunit NuoF n=1 Tax=Methanothermobacter sp. THM-2 TaxID=2606912 RepID=UPI00136628A4|nr:NADH-quinone oxidoreductase subunit NuoF [Methanothermobacter sp. THM-2]QHN08216.1 NADH-quinone oxidoreductase subunit NuoF [Methanothermobacter sp. THM-2]